MLFSDKLNFLMNITQTSNKELAAAISVDRSLISLLRTGKRGMPRNREHILHMAVFFSRHCEADFQRHALSEMLNQSILRSSMPASALAEYIFQWLSNDYDIVENTLSGISHTPDTVRSDHDLSASDHSAAPDNETEFFYGNSGKREAIHRLLGLMQQLEQPSTILFASDDNLEWLFEDYSFTLELQSNLMEIINRGFTICQIMPSINFMNRYVESLRYWLPLYVTGQTKVFYYPRLRDNLYRHSMIILPGQFAIFSTCVGMTSNPITLLTTNPALVYAYTGQYNDYLSLCQPALTVHNTSEELMDCFEDFFSRPGSIVQKVFPLSATTIPREILEQLRDKADHALWKTAYDKNLNELSSFEEHLKHTPFIDISELSDPKDIRSGKIPIAAPYKTYDGQSMYTPETYVLHLKNILRLMDTYDNYYFVPSKPDTRHDYNLFVKKEGMALLVRNTAPTLIIELKRPEIVTACREHLLRMAEQYCDGMQRTKARMQINALIHDLQD